MKTTRSEKLFKEACELIPGGVNSPVRACLGVGADPLFIASAKGSHVTTVDGQEMIDFVESWGPMLLGHSHPEVTKAVVEAAGKGTSYGAPCPAEVELARMVVDAFPGMDMVRMVNSGTEATMSALRLARGVTGRTKVLKFIGCYHGHADPFLASAGSGVATLSIPGTPGVPESTVRDTLLAPYNDVRAVEDIFHLYGKDIAAIIVEPIAGNMGLVLPEEGFLKALRALCDTHGALLIMDEVITGFRAEYGGAQTRFGITPDLTTLGKIIGGGLPVGAHRPCPASIRGRWCGEQPQQFSGRAGTPGGLFREPAVSVREVRLRPGRQHHADMRFPVASSTWPSTEATQTSGSPASGPPRSVGPPSNGWRPVSARGPWARCVRLRSRLE